MNYTQKVLANKLLQQYDLEWNTNGLVYRYKTKYGSIDYSITKDESKVFQFLGLPDNPKEIDFIKSTLFSVKVFNKSTDEKVIVKFYTEYVKGKAVTKFKKGKTIKTEKIRSDIEKFFGMKIQKVSKYVPMTFPKCINIKEIRNKFNGKLVMHWAKLNPGKILFQTMEDFKLYIEKEFNVGFLEYLNNTAPFAVRNCFLCHYYDFENVLGELKPKP